MLNPRSQDGSADPVAELIQWILDEATERDDTLGLLSELLDRLIGMRIPLWRISLGMPTIDPVLRGMSFICWRDRPPTVETTAHNPQTETRFQQSPIFYAESRGLMSARWRFEELTADLDLPRFDALREEGATDYVLRLVRFGGATNAVRGAALAFATDRPGGFDDDHIGIFDRLMPALGLVGRSVSIARTAQEALSVYLGPRTAERVLAGEIRRGAGQRISAAILIADLRGFTALTEREDAVRVVGLLDESLEAIGTAVAQHGGEVLKFLGDGLLAIFPFTDEPESAARVCAAALEAAEQALDQTACLNAERQGRGDPVLELDVVLHAGEVVYGNVGASRRLDFTVIGSAVNEASRMEGLCESLGRHLLLSEAFAMVCGRPSLSLGSFKLRGIDGERTIRVPAGEHRL